MARADGVGDERPGHEGAAELLEQDDQVQEAEAGAAVLLGDHEALPALLGHLLPELGAVALLVLFHVADVLSPGIPSRGSRGRSSSAFLVLR